MIRSISRCKQLLTMFGVMGFSTWGNLAFAQQDTLRPAFEYELSCALGKLVKIHGDYPKTSLASAYDLNLSWKTNGNSYWNAMYHYPSVGFSAVYFHMGNHRVLGEAFGVIPTMRWDKRMRKMQASIRAGLGFAYFNSAFDLVNHPDNKVIGSTLANMSQFKLECSGPLGKNYRYLLGITAMHCSNAHVAVPNIGANLIAMHVGIAHRAGRVEHEAKSNHALFHGSSWMMDARFIHGWHAFRGTTKPVGGPTYPVYGFSLALGKWKHGKGRATFGLNYHYYSSYYHFALSQELYPPSVSIRKKAQNAVLYGGYEWNFGRVALFAEVGLNVYHPIWHLIAETPGMPPINTLNRWSANKLGYRVYFFTQNGKHIRQQGWNPYMQLAVKTNGGTADFLELSLGCGWLKPHR